jgi:SAM-dependent methyltransferase
MDMSLLYRIYEQLPRQGPGQAQTTQRAFASVPDLGLAPRILDIACGTGAQTVDLARLTSGTIVAIDNHQPFLDGLTHRARAAGVAERIACECMDMAHMDFASSSFDLIWSEGGIFILGFKQGLLEWRPFLRPRGILAVSEIAWLKPEPPPELIAFWGAECPDMVDAEMHLSTVTRCGFRLLDHFVLPEQAWWTDYYGPLEKVIARTRAERQADPEAMELLDLLQTEIDMYRKYSAYYGYIFYVMERGD